MNLIGIMQGRLVPPIEDRIQAFPGEQWKDEFPAARECDLDLIEWIFEASDWEKNAVMANPDEIIEYSQKYNIKVITLIADFFMDCPLLRVPPTEVETRMSIFEDLLNKAHQIGVTYVNVPFVDNSEITSDAERDQVARLSTLLRPLRLHIHQLAA
jgi:hexulose-6-phosphate isomerase